MSAVHNSKWCSYFQWGWGYGSSYLPVYVYNYAICICSHDSSNSFVDFDYGEIFPAVRTRKTQMLMGASWTIIQTCSITMHWSRSLYYCVGVCISFDNICGLIAFGARMKWQKKLDHNSDTGHSCHYLPSDWLERPLWRSLTMARGSSP